VYVSQQNKLIISKYFLHLFLLSNILILLPFILQGNIILLLPRKGKGKIKNRLFSKGQRIQLILGAGEEIKLY